MAFPTQFTAITLTTNASGQSGVINMGAIANRWSLQLVVSGQIGRPTVNVFSSTDDTNWSRVEPSPQPQIGQVWEFGVAAQYVQVNFAGNNGSFAAFLVGQSD